jgi:hypothetical protein
VLTTAPPARADRLLPIGAQRLPFGRDAGQAGADRTARNAYGGLARLAAFAEPVKARLGDPFDDLHNGREYERFAGRAITVPRALVDQPNPELLDWHAAEVFRG